MFENLSALICVYLRIVLFLFLALSGTVSTRRSVRIKNKHGNVKGLSFREVLPPGPRGHRVARADPSAAQAGLGMGVGVLCVNHEGGPTAVEHDGPVEVTRLGRSAAVAKLDVCPGLAARLARVAADADVLHLHVPNPTMILGLLRARPGVPVVVTYHSDVVRQRVLGPLFRPVERLAYRQVRAVLATSPTYPTGSTIPAPYGDRLHVLPHGIDLGPYLDPSPDDLALAAGVRERYAARGAALGLRGRQVYYKGFINAVRALTRVPGTLLLIGDGPDQPALAPRPTVSAWPTARCSSATCRITSTSPRTTARRTPSGSRRTPAARRSA